MDDKEIQVHLFHCANSVTGSESQLLRSRLGAERVRLLSLPCSGKVTIPYLLKAFEKGADGVAIVTCAPGECRNLEGNLRASKRGEAVAALLDEIGLGKGRVIVFGKEQGDTEKVIERIERFREDLHKKPAVRRQVESLPVGALQQPDSKVANRRETIA